MNITIKYRQIYHLPYWVGGCRWVLVWNAANLLIRMRKLPLPQKLLLPRCFGFSFRYIYIYIIEIQIHSPISFAHNYISWKVFVYMYLCINSVSFDFIQYSCARCRLRGNFIIEPKLLWMITEIRWQRQLLAFLTWKGSKNTVKFETVWGGWYIVVTFCSTSRTFPFGQNFSFDQTYILPSQRKKIVKIGKQRQ